MTAMRLDWAAGLMAVVAIVLSPVTCSQASDAPKPRCFTAMGYRTPFGEEAELLLLLALVLVFWAMRRRRRDRVKAPPAMTSTRHSDPIGDCY